MKKTVSNNKLILIVIIAVVMSSFSMLLSLTKIGLTGAFIDSGEVSVTVNPTLELLLPISVVEFVATKPGVSRNTYNTAEVINCNTDDHTGTGDPWLDAGNMYEAFHSCGIIMVNEGSNFINITIRESGELFRGKSYNAEKHFTYNITMNDQSYTTAYGDDGNCSVGYDMGLPGVGGAGHWRPVPLSLEVAVCYLNSSDTPPCSFNVESGWDFYGEDRCYRADHAMLELNITVPVDEPHGIKGGTLRLVAVSYEEED